MKEGKKTIIYNKTICIQIYKYSIHLHWKKKIIKLDLQTDLQLSVNH